MAFVKKTWKDRIVQYANRRLLTKSGGEVEQVTVTRDEGTISEAGDQFNASNMNDLEQRVKDGFDDVDTALSGKADTTQALTLGYTEVNVALDNSGEGTLFTQEVMVVGCKDLTSDSKYVGYIIYFTSNGQTKVKSFNRSSANYTSNAVSETRKIGVRYLKYIS